MVIVLVCAFQFACLGLVGPTDPDKPEPIRQVSVEVIYERVAPINTTGEPNLAFLASRCFTPGGWIPNNPGAGTSVEMRAIDEKTHTVNLSVWTTYENILWVGDLKINPPGDIAKNIYVNGVLLTKSEYGGPVGLYGRVRFIIKNDGSIIEP
jgi:hypothetical protein